MVSRTSCRGIAASAAVALACGVVVAQTPTPPPFPAAVRADVLRGEYGRYRANNDLLTYHLDVRVDPEKKSITGKNKSLPGPVPQRNRKHPAEQLDEVDAVLFVEVDEHLGIAVSTKPVTGFG